MNCILNPKLLPQGPAAIRQYGDYSLDAVINKYRNDPDPVTDTVSVINKYRNDPDPVTDTVRARNNFL